MSTPNGNDTTGKWIAIAVLALLLGGLIWLGGRSLLVVPSLAWTWLNLQIAAWLGTSTAEAHPQHWAHYILWSRETLEAVVSRRIFGSDVPWNALITLHGIASAETRWIWVGFGGLVTFYALFATRKPPPAITWHLTGITKTTIHQIGRLHLRPGLLAKLLAPIARTSKVWRQDKPSFFAYQARAWPTTKVALRFGPTRDDLPEPALTPVQWMMRVCPGLGQRDVPWAEAEHAFRRALVAQLGPRWPGLANAPSHVRALALLAWTNRVRGQDDSTRLAGLLADAFPGKARPKPHPIPPWDAVAKQIQRFLSAEADQDMDRIAARHAYLGSAFVAMLASGGPFQAWGGGEAGVLAPAQYLWLRLYDRVLWYAAQNVGRHAYFIEGAACSTHMLAERAVGKPIPRPHVDDIILAKDEFGNIHGLYGSLVSLKLIPTDTPTPPDILKAEWFRPLLAQ